MLYFQGKQEATELKLQGRETETGSDSKDIDASPEETRAALVVSYASNKGAAAHASNTWDTASSRTPATPNSFLDFLFCGSCYSERTQLHS